MASPKATLNNTPAYYHKYYTSINEPYIIRPLYEHQNANLTDKLYQKELKLTDLCTFLTIMCTTFLI